MKFYISSFALLALSAAAPVAFGGDPEVRPPLPSSGEVEDPLPLLRSGSKGGSGNEALVSHDLSGAAISSTIDEDLGDTLFDTLFAPHDVSDGALDPPIGEDAGGSRFDGSNGAADPLGSGDEAHLDFGSKRRFLSLKKAPKFSKKFSKKTPKKAKKSKTTPTPSDRANIAGKYTYFPDCKNYIDEVTIQCIDDSCTFFQEALERLECGEVVEDENRCQLLGTFSYQDKVQSTKLETIDLVSYGVCRFKDGDVEHGAPNAVRAEFDPNGTMNLFYSVDGGNSFFTDVRVADQEKPDDLVDGLSTRRRLQGCGGQCGGSGTTFCTGGGLCTMYRITDLMRGISLVGADDDPERPHVFQEPKYQFLRAFKSFELTEFIESGEQAIKSTGVDVSLSASYGPFKSKDNSFEYFKKNASTSNTMKFTITLVKQAFNLQAVDDRDLKFTKDVEKILYDKNENDVVIKTDPKRLYDVYGSRYIKELVYGTTLSINFQFSTSVDDNKREIAATLGAGVKGGFVGSFAVEMNQKANETKTGEFFTVDYNEVGLKLKLGKFPELEEENKKKNLLDYAVNVRNIWESEADKAFEKMETIVEGNPNPNGTESFPLQPIAFITAPIKSVKILEDNGLNARIARDLARVGATLAVAQYNIAKLDDQKTRLEKEADVVGTSLKGIMELWKAEHKKLRESLVATREACFAYKRQSATDLANGTEPIPDAIDEAVIDKVKALCGNGFLNKGVTIGETETKFPDMSFQGFVVDGKAWYKGTLECAQGRTFNRTDLISELEKTSQGECLDETNLQQFEEGYGFDFDAAKSSSVSSIERIPSAALDDDVLTFAETRNEKNPWFFVKLEKAFKIAKIEIVHAPPTDGNNKTIVSRGNGVAKYGWGGSLEYKVPKIPGNAKVFDDGDAFTASFSDEDLLALDTDTGKCIDKGHVFDKGLETEKDCSIVHYRDQRDVKKWYNRLRCRDSPTDPYYWLNESTGIIFTSQLAYYGEDNRVPGKTIRNPACTYYKTMSGNDSNYSSDRQELRNFSVKLVEGKVKKDSNGDLIWDKMAWDSKRQQDDIPLISTFFPAGTEGDHVIVQNNGKKTMRLAEIRVYAKKEDVDLRRRLDATSVLR